MAESVFARNARRYIELGYSPIPRWLGDDGREHFPMEWSKYCHEVADENTIKKWCLIPNAMIALCCGYRGLAVFDADTEIEEEQGAILESLSGFQVGRFGSKGFALLTRHHGGQPQKFFNIYTGPRENSVKAIEIKGDGQNITVPPSVHFKTGEPYLWFDPFTGESFDELPAIGDLPVMDESHLECLKVAMWPYATPPRPDPERKRLNGNGSIDPSTNKRLDRWYHSGLSKAITRLSGLSAGGGRPSQLFREACALGAGVHHGLLSRDEFEEGMLEGCRANGLLKRDGRHACLASINSALRLSENDGLPDLGESKSRNLKGRSNGGNGHITNCHEGETVASPHTGTNENKKAIHSIGDINVAPQEHIENLQNGHDTHSNGVTEGIGGGKGGKRTEKKDQKPLGNGGPPREPLDPRPTIQIQGGSLSRNATEAEKILYKVKAAFYHQAGRIVRPARSTLRDNRGEKVMVPAIVEASSVTITDAICTHAHVQKWDKRIAGGGDWVDCDPPPKISEIVIDRRGEGENWHTLAGVSATPIIRRDGTIAFAPGLDEMTGIFLLDPVSVNVPDNPSVKDARLALALLIKLIEEFPFIDLIAHSVALSSILTPIARSGISVAPMHVAKAPAAGTGKSYLFNIMAAISQGTRCPVIAAGKDDEETEKRVAARMIAGNPIICIDNVNGILGGDLICQGISEDIVAPRVLGLSKAPNLTNRFSFFATGNNISVAGDLDRRVLPCVMDRQEETPSEHRFEFNPIAMVLAERSRYVSACLTILRAHARASFEGATDLTPFNGFDEWSNMVRGALIWLGREDPVKALDLTRTENPQRQLRASMHKAMEALFGMGPGNAKTVAQMILAANSNVKDGKADMRSLMKDIFINKADRYGNPNSLKIGHWLKSFKDVVIEGKKLQSITEGRPMAEWFIAEAAYKGS